MAVRLDIRPGEGTICRRGGVAAWVANDIASELRERLLALLGSSDAPEGRAMLRRVAGLIIDAPDAESGIGFGVLAQETDTLAVLLHGRVSVAAERGARLTGAESPTWLDSEIPLDGVIILGPGTPEDLVPSSPFIVPTDDLPDGLGSGGGLVVHVLADVREPTAGAARPEGAESAAAAGLAAVGAGTVPAAPEDRGMEPSASTPVSAAAGGAATAEDVAPAIGTSADLGPSDEPPFEPPSSEPLASEAGLPYEHVPTHAPPAYESPIVDEPVTELAAEPAMDVAGGESIAPSAAVEPPTSAAPFDEEEPAGARIDEEPVAAPVDEEPPEAPIDEEEPPEAPSDEEAAAEAPFVQEEPAEVLVDEEGAAEAPFDQEEPAEAPSDEEPATEAPFDQEEPAEALVDEEGAAEAPFDQELAAAIDQGPPAGASQIPDEASLEPGDTTATPSASPAAAPPPPPPPAEANENGVASAPDTAMVSAVVCELGHVNDPRLWECMVCGRAIPPQHPVTVVQPSLGVLVLDDGSVYELDRGYVVGRAPEVAEAVQTGYVRALTVSDPEHLTSRAHLEVRLEEWDVVVADLGSANGTFIWNVGDADWARLIPHQGVVLRPGGQLAFGRRSISFERALPQ